MTRLLARPYLFVIAAVTLIAGGLAAPAAAATVTATSTSDNVVHSCSQHVAPGAYTCFALRRTDIKYSSNSHFHPATAKAPATNPAGYGPSDLASAYDLPTGNGAGQRVYIVDAYNDPNAPSDLAVYRAQYGLPSCTVANGCFRQLNQYGATSPLPTNNADWAGEESLDLDAVSAACPKCDITLVEASDDGNGLNDAVEEAVALGAKFVSMSWGGGEYSGETEDDQNMFAQPGVVFTASAGDDGYAGYENSGPSYPATSPDVVAVGGTSLTRDSSTRGWSEKVWNDGDGATGSGCSLFEPKPSWETISSSVCNKRAEADISADADPETGLAVYQTYGGKGWDVYGGTSASAPMIAGSYALAGTPSLTVSPQYTLWHRTSSLNDVTSGNNGSSCGGTALCIAGPGWDGPTGLGTPEGITALTPAAPDPGTFVPLNATRLLDTRNGTGVTTSGARAARSTTALQVGGKGGVPHAGVEAVSLNVTAVSPAKTGYVTAWAAGGSQPGTSNVSFTTGKTQANLVVAPVSSSGVVDLYVSQSTQLVADVAGYWAGGSVSDPGAYQPVTPTRLLDTRSGIGTSAGAVPTHGTVVLQVSGGVVPAGAQSAVVSLTAVSPSASGYITAWADGDPQPTASNLNYVSGVTLANSAIVPLSSDGKIDLYVSRSTQLLADVVGYHVAGQPVAAGAFTAVTPDRILDTRPNGIIAGSWSTFSVYDDSDIPAGTVSAVALNVTDVSPTAGGFVTAYAGGGTRPGTSNLNDAKGQTMANLVIVPVSADGTVTLYTSATTNLLADVAGYYRKPTG